ncbi:MAG TPA: sulfatase-like hydrolase/transferase, partial [Verrucomicrobiae bacterium]|nr:sulfatase-like hydrolase/transferase [Verrucomicrobiae bacterium]
MVRMGWARWACAALALVALGATSPAGAQNDPVATVTAPTERPNIVLILIDDAGFTDLGAYGGEARTTNIDALAQRGVRFSNYHSSPLCSPSRAMLLTGVDNHRT